MSYEPLSVIFETIATKRIIRETVNEVLETMDAMQNDRVKLKISLKEVVVKKK